jgi:XisH protein
MLEKGWVKRRHGQSFHKQEMKSKGSDRFLEKSHVGNHNTGYFTRVNLEKPYFCTTMARKDLYHHLVRNALAKDGWKITHDPLIISAGKRKLKVDLGAEPIIAAERGDDKIAVEVKNFINLSQLHDFYEALGQFKFYWHALQKVEPERSLFLAISTDIYSEFFDDAFVQEVASLERLKIIVFNIEKESIVKWIK